MKIIFSILVVISFAPPFIWGHSGAPFWVVLVWSAVLSLEAVYSGWRAPRGGVIGSFVFGIVIATVFWSAPTFWLGHLI
jgi:hypothetical protein